MPHLESTNIEKLVAAHLAGEQPDIPESQQSEFEQALAAHAALQRLIDQTFVEPSTNQPDRSPPTLPIEYRIEREIGKGGMGVVYLAHQQSLNRDVALKVLRPGEQTFGPLVKRFLGEAQHLARLRHPNIVAIHEIGDAEGEPYFTMDYIDGESLSTEIRRGPMSPTQALTILKQIGEGVQHAHRQGIIHRDLKPSNVLIDHEGAAYVTDFGLARDVSQTSELTQTGELLGTPQYMAPEQARGQSLLIGEATDVHALGLLLFEMLTGRPVFDSSSPADVLVQLLNEEPPLLRSTDRRIPRDLETICQKALQKSPTARYHSVSAMLEDIRRYESGQPLVARRTRVVRRTCRWVQRHRKITAAIVTTAAVVLAVAFLTGPMLFDKTSAELMSWAQELHDAGKHVEAVQVYHRALKKTEGDQRHVILNKIVRCSGEIGDAEGVLSAALPILEEIPDASFGEYDYLIAQAIYAEIVKKNPNLLASTVPHSDKEFEELEFAANRFSIFMDGSHGTASERELAADKLTQIHRYLDATNSVATTASPQPVHVQLPEGTLEELQAVVEDKSNNRWQRGMAAYASGLIFEDAGRIQNAAVSYTQAFDLMRSVFPTYAGISTKTRNSQQTGIELVERDECQLLRDVHAAARRFNPDSVAELQGGLRLNIEGVELPVELVHKLSLELLPKEDSGHDVSNRQLPRHFAFQGSSGWIGIADGRYRAEWRPAGSISYSDSAGHLSSLLEIDFSGLPKELEIRGDVIEFAVPARMITEITMVEPVNNETINLNRDFFQWSQIEGADHYMLTFALRDSRVGQGVYYKSGASVRVNSNRVCLSTLTEPEMKKVAWLVPGATAVWNVHAIDSHGKRIGASVETDRAFLVGHAIIER